MIAAADPQMIADAKRFAALSAIYQLDDALPQGTREDSAQALVVASALALASDTNPSTGAGWLLRSTERHAVLDALRHENGLAAAVAERRRGRLDAATTDLLDALEGEGLFAPGRLGAAIDDPDATSATIERIVSALDRADAAAPGFASLKTARIRLAELTDTARRESVIAQGFRGRDTQRAMIADWLATPLHAPPMRAALLTGPPGTGKSTLIEATIALAAEQPRPIVVTLDFDRAGLDVLDLRGLTMEVARQIVDQIGASAEPLLDVRLTAAGIDGSSAQYEGSARATIPNALAMAIGATVTAATRPVVLILDTVDVLRARGERHVAQLFDWIDRLVADGMAPLAILAVGRSDVFDTCPDRKGLVIELGGVDDVAAAMLLDRLAVAPAERPAVLDIGGDSALTLRLAAALVQKTGTLPRRRRKGDQAVSAGLLYHLLLKRIADPDLRRLARFGLVARRLSVDFLRAALAPQLGMKDLTAERAQRLFDALGSEDWLVEPDPTDPLFMRHRRDLRGVLLPLLYGRYPARCARIDAAAMRWFGQRTDTAAQVDTTYHSLQLMRSRLDQPMIDGGLARLLDPVSIAELPEAAQIVVGRARGESSVPSGDRSSGQPGSAGDETVEILRHLVEAGDWEEGRLVVDQVMRDGLDPCGIIADAVRAFHWRSGQWAVAHRHLVERDRHGIGDNDLNDIPPHLALARLEMRAEVSTDFAIDPSVVDRLFVLTDAPRVYDALTRFGALGFVLAAYRKEDRDDWNEDGDPVAAAIALWSGKRGPAADFAFARARDRLRARGMSSIPAPADDPQMIATLTPYAVFAANLATQPNHAWIDVAAREGELRLTRAGALINATNLSASLSHPIGGIADLGLFAEWADVAAMASTDADLLRIARSAECWRRAVAGDWPYGPSPAHWNGARPVDGTLALRVSTLADERNPRHAAFAQLGIWASDEDGERLWRMLQRRFTGIVARAAMIPDPLLRAARLRRHLPAAFVPAATILTANLPGEA